MEVDQYMKIKTMEQLMHHQLQDLHSAETMILEALPQMEEVATSKELKRAFKEHQKQTQGQVKRLEQAMKKVGTQPGEEKCKGMDGIIREGKSMIKNGTPGDVLDAALIAAAQKVEHYEISAYGTARAHAQEMGQGDVAELLGATLEEESMTNERLNELALNRVNPQAMAA
jgi:ferritin-like metal-binding protein YciE